MLLHIHFQPYFSFFLKSQWIFLFIDEDGATPLMFAAMCGHHNVAEHLLDRGADIDSQDRISGWTALMQATYYRYCVITIL